MENTKNYDMSEYRNKIMHAIVSNENMVRLLEEDPTGHPEDTIPYSKAYPYEYIPDETAESGKYISFELHATTDEKNKLFKSITVSFFILCHADEVRTTKGLWYDSVSCELENVFAGGNLGIGKTSFISNIAYAPNKKFKGRLLSFAVKELQYGISNGT